MPYKHFDTVDSVIIILTEIIPVTVPANVSVIVQGITLHIDTFDNSDTHKLSKHFLGYLFISTLSVKYFAYVNCKLFNINTT